MRFSSDCGRRVRGQRWNRARHGDRLGSGRGRSNRRLTSARWSGTAHDFHAALERIHTGRERRQLLFEIAIRRHGIDSARGWLRTKLTVHEKEQWDCRREARDSIDGKQAAHAKMAVSPAIRPGHENDRAIRRRGEETQLRAGYRAAVTDQLEAERGEGGIGNSGDAVVDARPPRRTRFEYAG